MQFIAYRIQQLSMSIGLTDLQNQDPDNGFVLRGRLPGNHGKGPIPSILLPCRLTDITSIGRLPAGRRSVRLVQRTTHCRTSQSTEPLTRRKFTRHDRYNHQPAAIPRPRSGVRCPLTFSPKNHRVYIELHWKDYKRFGPDGSSGALAQWLMSRLQRDYGDSIETICITGYCRSLSGPNKNLTPIFERFEEALSKLRERPSIRFSAKRKELAIDYATVWPTADEFDPDSLMMKVGTFRRAYLKLITLLEQANDKIGGKTNFDFVGLIADIRSLEPEVPSTLDDLVDLYTAVRRKKGEQDMVGNPQQLSNFTSTAPHSPGAYI